MKKKIFLNDVEFCEPVVIGRPMRLTCSEHPDMIMTTSRLLSCTTTEHGYLYETEHTQYDVRLRLATVRFENVVKPTIIFNAPVTFQADGISYVTDEVVSARTFPTGALLITRTARIELVYAQ